MKTTWYGLTAFVIFLLTFFSNLLLWAGLSLVLAWPIKALWNWLLPSLFNFPVLDYWQAWGMEVLIGLLFGVKASLYSQKKNQND